VFAVVVIGPPDSGKTAVLTALQKRMVEREPPGWSGLPRLLRAADEIAVTSRLLEDIDIVCSTDDTTPLSVAAQIRSARPPLLERSPS
jgi:hypothetical protein